MERSASRLFLPLLMFPVAFAWSQVPAQILLNGNMDSLMVGTNPDVGMPAGAWQFPESYVTAGVAETDPSQLTVVPTNSFETGGTGNSLAMNVNDAVLNVHLANLFTQVINETPGQTVTIQFDIWVPSGTNGGGAVYVGGDHGGGGFSNVSDRGPQVLWQADGTFTSTGAGGISTVMINGYARDTWRTVRIVADLNTDTFDVLEGPRGGTLAQVGTGLSFRSTSLTFFDRFTYVHFGGTIPWSRSFLDNVSVTVPGGGTQTLFAQNVSFTPGIIISGTVQNLNASDDQYLVVRPGIVFSTQQDPLVMNASFTAPQSTASQIQFRHEARANQANIRQTVYAFNFTTMQYVQLDQRNLPTSDTVVTVNLSPTAQFIGPGNEIRMRVNYRTVGPVFSYPWLVSMDESVVLFTP